MMFSQLEPHRLYSVLCTLFSKPWDPRDYDIRLRDALANCLTILHIEGFVAHLAERDVTLSYFRPEYDGATLVGLIGEQVTSELERRKTGHSTDHDLVIPLHLETPLRGFAISMEDRDRTSVALPATADCNYCCLVYKANGKWRQWRPDSANEEDKDSTAEGETAARIEENFQQYHARATLPMLFHVMMYRESRLKPFPGKVSQRYWEDSAELLREPSQRSSRELLRPPWDVGDMVRTATLSFDLRKSTFCMEQANDPKEFGDWLDELVQILTYVCHSHGGVFDKFTGDGALVHFLKRECELVYETEPVVAAVDCAVDMHRAIEIHLKRLRQFLRFDSDLLGAGIAIDISDTFWALDHRDNPITVGRSVVGACRLCDKTPACMIHMTNIAFQSLRQDIRKKLPAAISVPLESKEMNSDMKVTVWEFAIPSAPPDLDMGKYADNISTICQRVYESSNRRRPKHIPDTRITP